MTYVIFSYPSELRVNARNTVVPGCCILRADIPASKQCHLTEMCGNTMTRYQTRPNFIYRGKITLIWFLYAATFKKKHIYV